jgi:hypothetical protein
MPVAYRNLDTIDLSNWDGNPQIGPDRNRLLDQIGRKTGRRPKPDFDSLTALEAEWRAHGLSLAQFRLEQRSAGTQIQAEPAPASETVRPTTAPPPSAPAPSAPPVQATAAASTPAHDAGRSTPKPEKQAKSQQGLLSPRNLVITLCVLVVLLLLDLIFEPPFQANNARSAPFQTADRP